MDADAVTASLERAAERVGNPAAQIYARLFMQAPELEPMFALDGDGAVRNEMVRLCFDALIDLCGEGQYARGLFTTEVQNHGMLGVTPQQFRSLFDVLRDVVREVNGEHWTERTEAAWRDVLGRVESLVRSAAA